MNIVFHRYNSICEPGYIDAFKALGMDVIEDKREMTDKSISADERIRSIGEMILTHRPVFVFSINFFPYISDVCERLGVMYVCVSVDCPVAELLDRAVRNRCNRIFLFDSRQYAEAAAENPDCVFHLPLGVNPLIQAPDNAPMIADVSFIGSLYTEKDPYRDIYDSLSERTRGFCDGLLAAQEMLPGLDLADETLKGAPERAEVISEFNKYLPAALSETTGDTADIAGFWAVQSCLGSELTVRDRLTLLASVGESVSDIGSLHLYTRSDTHMLQDLSPHTQIHGGVSTLTEMPRVIAGSRININTTMRPIRAGLPQRIWDVLGCGGFLLTDARPDMPDGLIPGVHLETYASVDEACDKVRYYLTHEDERARIAAAGYEAVHASHTILHRVISMISLIMGDSAESRGGDPA